MPQFDVSSFSSQLFWLTVVFVLLYISVSKYIVPTAEYILRKRENILEENLNNAEKYNERAKEIELLCEAKTIEVNSYIEDLYKQANERLDRSLAEQKNELNLALAKRREQAVLEVQDHAAEFRANQTDSCIKLAEFIIRKITDKNVDTELLKEIRGKLK